MPELENITSRLTELPHLVTGALARAALGCRRGHGPAELLVEAPLARLQALFPAGTAHGPHALALGDLLLHAAPEGLEAGLRRRAVRLDAVGFDPTGRCIDPLDGRTALEVGDFGFAPTGDESADGLIPLRVAALASELAQAPSDAVMEQVAEMAPLVLRAPRDAIRTSLTSLLVGRAPAEALVLLERSRVLGFTLPEVAALVDLHRSARFHHKDVWLHTCQVVRQAIPRPDIRWAALLHDIGKPYTRTFEPPREVHFLHHDELGAVMFDGIAARLQFPAILAARVRTLIFHHLRANLYQRSWTDSAVRRFGLEMGELFGDLLHLSRADVTSRRPGRRREAMANLHDLRCRVERVRREDAARAPAVPKGLGAAIISELGVTPGPGVGELRRLCENAVRRGELPTAPGIDVCIAYLRETGAA